MSELAARLREAIDRSPHDSIRKFAAAFERRAALRRIRGRSYASLHKYLAGESAPPSDEWLRCFADVALVRFEWLRNGEGEPTVTEERERRAAENARPRSTLYEIIAEDAVSFFGPSGVYGSTLGAFHTLALRVIRTCPDADNITDGQMRELVRRLRDVVLAPAGALTKAPPLPPLFYDGVMDAYVLSMCGALLPTLRGLHEGLPVAELLELLAEAQD